MLKNNFFKINSIFLIRFRVLSAITMFFSVLFISFSVFCVFNFVPDDYLQGYLVKIMYVHVPSAWLSLFLYFVFAVCSGLYIVKLSPIYDIFAKSLAYINLYITTIAIITGSIWGKPAWGTWWVWDARLTSMLILFFILIGYFLIRDFFIDEWKSAKIGAVFAIIGAVNIPIIKFSVNLWNTLHQPSSIIKISGPSIHFTMLYPLITMFFGMLFFILFILLINIKTEIYRRKIISNLLFQ